MTQKVLTVVVPTYNMEKYLDRCLSSLIIDEDKMPLLEVLVVNDGSKDRSSEIAHGYEARYPETFRVIDKENGNYGSCINRGISEATGKYFRILDADDWYSTDALQSFIGSLVSVDADMVITPFYYSGRDSGHCVSCSQVVERNIVFNIRDIHVDSVPLFMHSTTFRHQALVASGTQLDTGVSYTDSEFCFLPLLCVNSIAFLDDLVYYYNANREGQTVSATAMARSTNSMYVVVSRLISHYVTNAGRAEQVVRRLWERWLIEACRMYYYTSLTLCIEDDDSKLHEVDSKVRSIPVVDGYISQLCIHHIHYVKMWRNKGRRYSHPFVRIHDAVWRIADPVWMQLLKWFCPSRL